MDIVKAEAADLDSIMALIRDAVAEMNRRGNDQWDDLYPNPEVIGADIAAGNLYKVTGGDAIQGIVVINEEQSPEYADLTWEDAEGRYLCVHRLCVRPAAQHRGLAGKLMDFAEAHAVKHGYTSIRLDTYTKNKIARQLYDSRQYRRRGTVRFRRGEFYCYEKVLA